MDWQGFYLASAGAAAALTGLLFVGISINISKILAYESLIDRSSISIVLLMNALIVSLCSLVPGQTDAFQGIEIITTGLISWLIVTMKDRKIYRSKNGINRKKYILLIVIDQIAMMPFVIAGAIIFTGCDCGHYWIVSGIIFSLIKAILDSWVLLIEINR
ncbi:MAG: hypothetical protein ABI528_05210 [bacterium]